MLEVAGINVFIGHKKIIYDTSFQVKEGHVVGLIGPNGSGKTTIMKTILGLTHFQGDIRIDGEQISETDHQALARVGALIEHPAIYPFMTGYQNLKLYSKEAADLAEVVSLLQMEDYIHNKAKDYSLGMKQKLGIAISLLNNPKLVILDEPMNGLDLASTILVRNIIKKYAERGTSFLISSHILSELQKVMTDVILIADGKLIIDQPMSEFYQLSNQNFKLLTEDIGKTMDLFVKEGIAFSKSESYLILNKQDLYSSQDLLYAHQLYIKELTPIGDSFEEAVVSLLEGAEK